MAQETPAKQPEPASGTNTLFLGDVSDHRKANGKRGGYTKKWDLSAMPHYAPKQKVSGTLSLWGNDYIRDGDLADYWREGFGKFQPDLKIDYHLPTSAMALPALSAGVADISMGRTIQFMELLTFEQQYHHDPVIVRGVRGTYDVKGWNPGYIIIVNSTNPISRINMKQLDGVFGGARSGGYVGSTWHTEYPYSRGPEENIRTWGQLGLTGEWADKPIHTGGSTLSNNQGILFSSLVLKGSLQFAENYTACANYTLPGWTPDKPLTGGINRAGDQVYEHVAADPYAIYYTNDLLSLGPKIKELAVQGENGGPYVERTLESVHDLSYPLANYMYFFLDRKPGQPVAPKVSEFMHYILSQEGQSEVQREGRYIPLTPEVVREELKLLE